MQFDTHELAWAAGFFDGEGSIFYRGRKRRELTLTVAQADRRPLDRFVKTVQIGSVRGPYKPRYKNGKPYYVYSIASHLRVQAVIAMLWKWLSEPKREQASGALLSALPYLRTQFIRGSKGRSVLSMEQANALRDEYELMKVGRVRAPRDSRRMLLEKYGLKSVNTLSAICANRGYVDDSPITLTEDPIILES
jgi:hypothetical protein